MPMLQRRSRVTGWSPQENGVCHGEFCPYFTAQEAFTLWAGSTFLSALSHWIDGFAGVPSITVLEERCSQQSLGSRQEETAGRTRFSPTSLSYSKVRRKAQADKRPGSTPEDLADRLTWGTVQTHPCSVPNTAPNTEERQSRLLRKDLDLSQTDT